MVDTAAVVAVLEKLAAISSAATAAEVLTVDFFMMIAPAPGRVLAREIGVAPEADRRGVAPGADRVGAALALEIREGERDREI